MTELRDSISTTKEKIEKKVSKDIKTETINLEEAEKLRQKIESKVKTIGKNEIKGIVSAIKPAIYATTVRPIKEIDEEKIGSSMGRFLGLLLSSRINETDGIRLLNFSISLPKGTEDNKLLYDYTINIAVFGGLVGGIWEKLANEIGINYTKEKAKNKAVEILSEYANINKTMFYETFIELIGTKPKDDYPYIHKLYNMLTYILMGKENKDALEFANLLLGKEFKSIKDIIKELHKRSLGKENKIEGRNIYIIEIHNKENLNTKQAIKDGFNISKEIKEIKTFNKKDSDKENESFKDSLVSIFLDFVKDIQVYLREEKIIERLITKDLLNDIEKEIKIRNNKKIEYLTKLEKEIDKALNKKITIKVETDKENKTNKTRLDGLRAIILYLLKNPDEIDKFKKIVNTKKQELFVGNIKMTHIRKKDKLYTKVKIKNEKENIDTKFDADDISATSELDFNASLLEVEQFTITLKNPYLRDKYNGTYYYSDTKYFLVGSDEILSSNYKGSILEWLVNNYVLLIGMKEIIKDFKTEENLENKIPKKINKPDMENKFNTEDMI